MNQSGILIIEDDSVVARSLQAGLSRDGFKERGYATIHLIWG